MQAVSSKGKIASVDVAEMFRVSEEEYTSKVPLVPNQQPVETLRAKRPYLSVVTIFDGTRIEVAYGVG